MNQRKIGNSRVGAIGLGCMGMSFAYGTPNNEESQRVLRRSLELGINHWDTADMYGAGKNEELLNPVLKDVRDQVFLATKFGNVFDRTLTSHQDQVAAEAAAIVDGTPDYARKCIENSLTRLGVDHVDLYYLHRIDPHTPIEDTIGAMAEFVKEGKVLNIGISKRAPRPCAVRTQRTLLPLCRTSTRSGPETLKRTSSRCARSWASHSLPTALLGRGFLTGEIKTLDDLTPDDGRRRHPRFQADNFAKNLDLVDRVKAIAEKKGVKPSQIALAWVLSQGEQVAPIPGTKRLEYLEQNAEADQISLTAGEKAELDGFIAAGERYPEQLMKFVNA